MKLAVRIVLGYCLVFGLAVYWVLGTAMEDLRSRYAEAVEEVMVDQSRFLAVLIEERLRQTGGRFETDPWRGLFDETFRRKFKATIYRLEKERVDFRVYVTDRRGTVLFHSHFPGEEGRSYADWRDVSRTLRGEYGARTSSMPRIPASLGKGAKGAPSQTIPVMFVAAPIHHDGELFGVVSIGKPTTNLFLFLAAARESAVQLGLVTFLAVVTLNALLAIWLTRPVRRLTRYAEAIREGRKARLPRLDGSEIGDLGRALESMREALEGKNYVEDYVQKLTHEFKSPLSAMRGTVELLEEEMPREQRQKFLALLKGESSRMRVLVDRMLELATLENRRALETRRPVRMAPLLEEAAGEQEPALLAKGLRIAFTREADTDGVRVAGDAFLLRQGLENLLRNAIDFSPEGGLIRLTLATCETHCTVEVTDQGPGLPDYALEKAFEKFFSLQRPATGKKSTGLGLAFVRQITALHDGTVSLANGNAGGAVATLILPIL